ncbi:3-keto-5-aminohexanoate cleavage protein [uncultured Roseibium sp.]|uniref:3-keto-5-aminohexanoate cleavage protein n=1 Tax=uncultured Roseibium sp. TaxID=1936171 RepID=UPI00321654C1
MKDLILNLAPTGMVPTREMSPHVPISPDEIVADCRKCADLGATILHVHARDESGKPTWRKEVYARIIGGIRETHPDVIICVSLSGRNFPEFEHRSNPLFLDGDLKPDMASLTLSSLNFARTESMNAPDMVTRLAETMAERGIRPELEVFDTGMVNYANYLVDRGVLTGPHYFNVLLGNLASAQATPLHLAAITQGLPQNAYWCAGGIGAAQLPANALGLLFGNGVRVGLEDFLWLDAERKQPATNAQMVERVRQLATTFGKSFASAGQVRKAFGIGRHDA